MNDLTTDRTNLDKGPVIGKTTTTDVKTGNLIVAIIAVVSTLGAQLIFSMTTL